MIELKNDALVYSFQEVHPEAKLTVHFQRTLRLPDDGETYPLPPGLGRFPIRHVDDYADRVPSKWNKHGGVMLPMYQSEALWICFESHGDTPYPFAIKIAAGTINAVNGDPWVDKITKKDYVVAPDQPWLDGFYACPGVIRQFVAMPLGQGHTAEEQITGEGEYGGLQIAAWPMKAAEYEKMLSLRELAPSPPPNAVFSSVESCEMGLAPGGKMKQEIYEDDYGFNKWDRSQSSRCFVHILNSQSWKGVSGTRPPTKPMNTKDYKQAGLPWFDYYDESLEVLDQPSKLTTLKSIGESANEAVDGGTVTEPPKVIQVGPKSRDVVREGKF